MEAERRAEAERVADFERSVAAQWEEFVRAEQARIAQMEEKKREEEIRRLKEEEEQRRREREAAEKARQEAHERFLAEEKRRRAAEAAQAAERQRLAVLKEKEEAEFKRRMELQKKAEEARAYIILSVYTHTVVLTCMFLLGSSTATNGGGCACREGRGGAERRLAAETGRGEAGLGTKTGGTGGGMAQGS